MIIILMSQFTAGFTILHVNNLRLDRTEVKSSLHVSRVAHSKYRQGLVKVV